MDSRLGSWGILLFCLLAPLGAGAETTRLTYPTAFYLELGGRGLGYGAGFDRMVSNELSAGVSIGMSPTHDAADNSTGKTATVIPAYVNYYLDDDGDTVFITGGITFVANDVKGLKAVYSGVEFPTRSVLPTIGMAYESRTDSGFLFRLTGLAVWGQQLKPWVGFNFGYCF